jgi:hypothetical protein
MEIETVFTETPHFVLVKEYETSPKIEDLTEVFSVVYRVDLPNWKHTGDKDDDLKQSMRYLFFTSLDKAFKQYKYYGPRGAVLSRIITDNDELIQLAEKSNFEVIVSDEEKEEEKEEVKEEEKVEETKM